MRVAQPLAPVQFYGCSQTMLVLADRDCQGLLVKLRGNLSSQAVFAFTHHRREHNEVIALRLGEGTREGINVQGAFDRFSRCSSRNGLGKSGDL
jgi:hypothetical protein